MRKTYNSVLDLVGNTPIVELNNFKKKYNLKSNVFVKLESFNPAGSAKDRVAVNMILTAEKNNLIKKGDTIIEPTSAKTGVFVQCGQGVLEIIEAQFPGGKVLSAKNLVNGRKLSVNMQFMPLAFPATTQNLTD